MKRLPLVLLLAVVLAGCFGVAPPATATDAEVLRTIAKHLDEIASSLFVLCLVQAFK